MISIDINKQRVCYNCKTSTSLAAASPDLDEPAEKELQSRSFNNSTDKYFYDKFLASSPNYIYINDLKQVVNDFSKCVGAIIASNVDDTTSEFAGTCFRIGTKYVITNYHVLEEIRKHGYKIDHADFNYNEEKSWCFKFEDQPVLVYGKDNFDYVILILQPNMPLPPSITEVGFSIATPTECFNGKESLTLVGHPDGKPKMSDPQCRIEPSTEDPNNLFYKRRSTLKGTVQYYPKTFFHGSSGSPGLLIRQKKVAILHCKGVLETEFKDDFWFGEGIMLYCIKEEVCTRIKNKSLQGVTVDDVFELKFGIQECVSDGYNNVSRGEMNPSLENDEPMELD